MRDIRFVRNFFLGVSCEFYHDGGSVMSVINIKYDDVAVDSLSHV